MTVSIKRVIILVMDSMGVGELPDACEYGDEGSNTLANCALAVGGLALPNLGRMGLGNILEIKGVPRAQEPTASYGRMQELSPGKDTTTGHWEMAGIILEQPFPVYPQGFPTSIITEFEKRTGLSVLGNKAASGTAIIEELGEEHVKTGKPIVYTSADSVFQIAAHEEVINLDRLYQLCKIAREILTGEHAVGRVIARPFLGEAGNFSRTANRHDFSLKPPRQNILNILKEAGLSVQAVGKIHDIFAGEGLTEYVYTSNNMEGVEKTKEFMATGKPGLIFTNLVEFDMLYGHRNDPGGYARALQEFDVRLPEIVNLLGKEDLLIITADHGCDPTTDSTDHSREYVPLLAYGQGVAAGIDLGIRNSFADVAATLADIFKLPFSVGESFAQAILGAKE